MIVFSMDQYVYLFLWKKVIYNDYGKIYESKHHRCDGCVRLFRRESRMPSLLENPYMYDGYFMETKDILMSKGFYEIRQAKADEI